MTADLEETSETPAPSQRVGPYHLGDRIGQGGMGEVFRAFDPRLNRWVALKRIRPSTTTPQRARRRFRREARAAARLDHPGIVRIHDVLSIDECEWIVMELVEGEPLDRVLAGGSLTIERGLNLARDLTSALHAAHAEGIVHRDIKATNVVLTRTDRARFLDFGLA